MNTWSFRVFCPTCYVLGQTGTDAKKVWLKSFALAHCEAVGLTFPAQQSGLQRCSISSGSTGCVLSVCSSDEWVQENATQGTGRESEKVPNMTKGRTDNYIKILYLFLNANYCNIRDFQGKNVQTKVKVKQSRYRPGVVQRVQGS